MASARPHGDALVRIQRALDYIESHLFEELPLDVIAAQATSSPWHFHRQFVALTGETPAGYTWKRRLSEACRRLLLTNEPLASVALECGFESQATFTRAFTRHVGVAPGRFRRTQAHSVPAYLYPRLDLAALAERQRRREFMEPRVVRQPAFQVVGMAGRFTPTSSKIPELWGRFAPRIHEIPHRRGLHTLGVSLDADPSTIDEVGFTYLACVEVDRVGDLPDGMIAATVPANVYAVLTHTGHISRLPDTVKHVWGRWLPGSPYRHVPAPDYERYDPERWDPGTGEGAVDLYVPIAAG
jgi:AraC family transcriptional regulator